MQVKSGEGEIAGPAQAGFENEQPRLERRREIRIPTDLPVEVRMMSPFNPAVLAARVFDVSPSGLKIVLDRYLQCNTVVQIRMPNFYILAEVRYCLPSDAGKTGFFAGVEIQDVCAY